jgi:hypothetical protein
MRFLVPFSCVFLIVCSCEASTNFSGSWAIDLKASTSPDLLLKRLQIPFVQRRFAASMKIEAVYKQSPDQLVIRARGAGFSRTEQIQINGPPETRKEEITGPYTIQTRWSAAGTQLITTYNFRTKDGKNAILIINRSLTDAGATLVLNGNHACRG